MTDRMIAFDPGLRCCGLAYFEDGVLAAVGCARNPYQRRVRDVPAWIAMAVACVEIINEWERPATVVYEMPEIYGDGGNRKGDPNDLMQLAGVLGALSMAYRDARWRGFRPKVWKGQVKKGVHHKRVRESMLTKDELKRLQKQLAGVPSSLRHNVMDAVGLGLYYLGRDG